MINIVMPREKKIVCVSDVGSSVFISVSFFRVMVPYINIDIILCKQHLLHHNTLSLVEGI